MSTEEKTPDTRIAQVPQPRHEPLPDEDEQAMVQEVIDEAAEAGSFIDEGLLEATCHQLFDLYQKTGNHEVRRLAKLVGQLGAAVLGADPREFFPDAPPIRDANGPTYAPTYPGEPRPGWPAAHEARGPQSPGGFIPTQPPVDRYGNPLPGYDPAPVPVPRMHHSNPSGAEMRVVNDPTGTMRSDNDASPMFMQNQPQQPVMPQRRPQRRPRR